MNITIGVDSRSDITYDRDEIIAYLTEVSKSAAVERSVVDYFADSQFQLGYMQAHFISQIHELMAKKGMSQNELAKAIGKSRQYVSRILNETVNLTLKTVAEIIAALGARVEITVHQKGERVEVKPIVRSVQVKTMGLVFTQSTKHIGVPLVPGKHYQSLSQKSDVPVDDQDFEFLTKVITTNGRCLSV